MLGIGGTGAAVVVLTIVAIFGLAYLAAVWFNRGLSSGATDTPKTKPFWQWRPARTEMPQVVVETTAGSDETLATMPVLTNTCHDLAGVLEQDGWYRSPGGTNFLRATKLDDGRIAVERAGGAEFGRAATRENDIRVLVLQLIFVSPDDKNFPITWIRVPVDWVEDKMVIGSVIPLWQTEENGITPSDTLENSGVTRLRAQLLEARRIEQ